MLFVTVALGSVTSYASGSTSYQSPIVSGDNVTFETLTVEATSITSDSITLASGWYVVDSNITVGSRITVLGDVHLILSEDCCLTANKGIAVNSGNSLAIYEQAGGTGTVIASCASEWNAGIGGDNGNVCGNITINGGIVIASGGVHSAGIGTGHNSGTDGIGVITINGGSVTATGGAKYWEWYWEKEGAGAGIGGGNGYSTSSPEIIIRDGVVIATGQYGGNGIGKGGGQSGNIGNITITGGNITAIGSYGIGGGGGGTKGTFSTGEQGTAYIFTNAIAEVTYEPEDLSCIWFNDEQIRVYNEQVIDVPITISENQTLIIHNESTLTYNSSITNNGIILNNGTFTQGVNGALLGTGIVIEATIPTIIYNGLEQNLINFGSISEGSIMYSVDGEKYSSDLPVATDAGVYNIYCKVVKSDNSELIASPITAEIVPKELKDTDVTITNLEDSYIFKGTLGVKPNLDIYDGDTKLINGTDYTVVYSGYEQVGTATVEISFCGNYRGETITETYDIEYGTVTASMISIPVTNTNGWYKEDVKISATEDYNISLYPYMILEKSIWLRREGEEIEQTYYIQDSDGNIYKDELIYNLDKTVPQCVIKVGDDEWDTYSDDITYSKFLKEKADIVITGTDVLSGVDPDTIQYQKVSIKEEYAVDNTWITGDNIEITTKEKCIVYARITDLADNVTIINSEGMVVYEDSEGVTTSFDFDKSSGEIDKTVHVILNGNTINEIYLDSADGALEEATVVSKDKYSIVDNSITLKAEYLETLTRGAHEFTISYNPMGETYVEDEGNQAPNTTTFTANIFEAIEDTTEKTQSVQYTGEGQSPSVPTAVIEEELTVKYKDANGEYTLDKIPSYIDTGMYTVEYQLSAHNYISETGAITYEITKAQAPEIVFPIASDIIEGDTLADSKLIGESIYGTFAWTDSSIISTVDNTGYEITFTPSMNTLKNYETIATTTTVVPVIVIMKEVYEVDKQEINYGGDESVIYIIDVNYHEFQGLYWEDKRVLAKNYTVKEGSTIITLSKEYVDTFPEGIHEFTAEFVKGRAQLLLVVNKAEDEDTNPNQDEEPNLNQDGDTDTDANADDDANTDDDANLNKDDAADKVVGTGDSSAWELALLLMIGSLLGSGILIGNRKKIAGEIR